LFANKLRSFLSLVGITIGIFSIISVKSAVDSLQSNVMEGFAEIGSNAIYVEKYPWNEDYENSYWKYAKRPEPSFDDYNVIKEKSKYTKLASYNVFSGGKTVSYNSSSVSGAFVMGASYEFQDIQKLEIEKGRYFTNKEFQSASNKIILGSTVASELFKNLEPVGRQVKVFGQKFTVIGVLKEEGESMFNFMNFDEVAWFPLSTIRRFLNISPTSRIGRSLVIKAYDDVPIEELKGEVTGILRSHRRLRPKETDNFSLMEMTALNDIIDGFFGTLNIAGYFIGGFALIVGMFSVANIMFVSVKERTNIIGIKKALGAQKGIILLEFLIEAMVLCLIGGLIGLLVTYGVIELIANVLDFEMTMTYNNALFGVSISLIVGIIAGIIPAYLASRMDPVDAIRA